MTFLEGCLWTGGIIVVSLVMLSLAASGIYLLLDDDPFDMTHLMG